MASLSWDAKAFADCVANTVLAPIDQIPYAIPCERAGLGSIPDAFHAF